MVAASLVWFGGYLLAGAAMAISVYFYWVNRNLRGVRYLLAGTLVGAVQSVLYLLLLVSPALTTKLLFWQLFTVLGGVVVYCWYLFTLAWTKQERARTRPALTLAALPLLLASGLILTNASPVFPGGHSLSWSSVTVASPDAVVSPLSVGLGPAVVAYNASLVVLATVGVGLVGRFTLQADQQLYRWRNTMFVLAGTTAVLFGVGFGLLENAFESQPLGYVLASSFVVLGLLRSGSYDVVSLPENSLIEAIDGGVVVYDADGSLIEYNTTAARLLDLDADIVGEQITTVLDATPQFPDIEDATDSPDEIAQRLDSHEFTTPVEDDSRTFLVRVSELTDDQTARLGWTVLVYDVTTLRQNQAELDLLKQVLSRVLRHNVRNELSVIQANAELLQTEATGETADRLQTILDTSDDLLEASEKARTVERLLEGERSRRVLDLDRIVPRAVESVQADYPTVEIAVEMPDSCSVQAHWGLSRAIHNVIENAVEHGSTSNRTSSGDADPDVTVTVEQRGQQVVVTVADNGPGIPEAELAVIDNYEETALEHASSLGLWLITWIVDLSRGEVSFENDDTGCTVTITLDHADADADQSTVPNFATTGSATNG